MLKLNINKTVIVITILCAMLSGQLVSAEEEVPAIKLEDVSIHALVKLVSKVTKKNFVVDPSVRGKITFITGSGISQEELYDTFISILQVHNLAAVESGDVVKILPIQKGNQTVAPIVSSDGSGGVTTSALASEPNFETYGTASPSVSAPSKIALDQTVTQVITLQYIPAITANATLTPLVGQGDTRIQVNQSSNALIVTGRAQNVERVIQLANNIDKPNNNDFELINLKYAVAAQVAQTLQQLLSPGQGEGALPSLGRVSADERTNSVLISGDKATRERLRAAIRRLDIPRKETGGTRVIKLRYAKADDMAAILQGISQGVQQQAAGVAEGSAAALSGSANLFTIAADRGTNSLVVTAPDYLYTNIMRVVKQLDIPKREQERGNTVVVKLKYAVADEMATTLQGIVQSVQQNTDRTAEGGAAAAVAASSGGAAVSIVPDRNTNSLIVTAPNYLYTNIRRVITQLDVPQKKKGGTVVVPLKYAKAEELVEVLKGVSPGLLQQTQGTTEGSAVAAAAAGGSGVSIQADKTTNSLVITAPEFMQANLRRVISQLDTRRAQVMIEAIIAEVSTDLARQLGVSMASLPQRGSSSGLVGASNLGNGLNQAFSLASAAESGAGGSLGAGLIFGLGKIVGNTQFGMIANALKGDAATNILATPTLVTLDNEEASIVVGQEVPFLTGSYTGGGSSTPSNPFNTIERRDVGLSLKVTPQINRGKTIKLKINQEISNVASSSASASDLITNKREIATNVMVEDGQILVLGGLVEDTFRDSEEKVPFLGDLPIIGRAFRSTRTAKTKQNLMVFIHPVILPDGEASNAYTRQKYETMQYQQGNSDVLTRGNKDQRASQLRGLSDVYSADDLHRPFDPFQGFGTCTEVFCPEGL